MNRTRHETATHQYYIFKREKVFLFNTTRVGLLNINATFALRRFFVFLFRLELISVADFL